MKLALIQENPTVGDLDGNAELLLSGARRAQRAGAELAVASELCLLGYPPRDLLERPGFVETVERATARVVQQTPLPLVFGSVGRSDGMLFNQAVVAAGGKELGRASKQLLPTYDVFDETRHFRAGTATLILPLAARRVALTICEDAWAEAEETQSRYGSDPLKQAVRERAELVLNLSASPFTLPKRTSRERIFRNAARRIGVPLVMVNQVGGNDELIFDGSSVLLGGDGRVLARARSFEPDLLIVDDEAGGRVEEPLPGDEAAAYAALVLGVRDYARKCGFQKAVLGLSGGIDSALVAVIAADALGPDNVIGVAMPSRYSSQGSVDDATALARNLGIRFETVPIEPVFQSYIDQLSGVLSELAEATPRDVTWENVQARIRGATIMAISNRTSALPLTTGNKSELAVGYCTLYGDMVGGLNAISDVPKTMVYRIARWLNQSGERIPRNSIEKPPSAELKPDQRDEDSLPPYDVLDPILERYVEQQMSPDAIAAGGFDRATVERVAGMVTAAEYKRRQAAPGLIISRKAFGSGRRLPIAQGFGRRVARGSSEIESKE